MSTIKDERKREGREGCTLHPGPGGKLQTHKRTHRRAYESGRAEVKDGDGAFSFSNQLLTH
eukprot:scaffold43533_cov350-Skeletonema_marinoi.AAC.1